MKTFKRMSVAALLGLLMLVLGLDAQAYQIIYQQRLVDNYGTATTSYQINANGIVADAQALKGQNGAAHSGGYFTIVPDNGDANIIKDIVVSLNVISTGYGDAYSSLNEVVLPAGVNISSVNWDVIQTYPKILKQQNTSSGVNSTYQMKLKTNTLYRSYVEATVQVNRAKDGPVNAHAELRFSLPLELIPVVNTYKTEATFKAEDAAKGCPAP